MKLFWPRSEAIWPLRPLYISLDYTEMTEYQVPGCWLVTSVAVTLTSEAVTSTAEAQSKHDEIQEKMAATRGAIKTWWNSRKRKENPVASEASHVYAIQRAKRASYMRWAVAKRPREARRLQGLANIAGVAGFWRVNPKVHLWAAGHSFTKCFKFFSARHAGQWFHTWMQKFTDRSHFVLLVSNS